jgi:uncharacterized RDD family membrane protein YckC
MNSSRAETKDSPRQSAAIAMETSKTKAIENGAPLDAGSVMLGRTLAALIDYVLLQAIMFACTRNAPDSDLVYYLALGMGALYLTAGNSCVMNGQTLGKKVFGLRVLSVPFDRETPYLSLSRSFYRYLGLYGGIVLLKEVPSLIFRANGAVASIYLLDSYMLPALIYPIALFVSILIHPWQRGLHDGLASSIVVRSSLEPPRGFSDLTYALGKQKSLIVAAIGIILGSIFWALSVVHPPQIRSIYEQRFALEKMLPIRLYRVDLDAEGPHLHVISITTTDTKLLAKELAEYLAPKLSQDAKSTNVLLLSFYRQQEEDSQADDKLSEPDNSQSYRYTIADRKLETISDNP